MGEERWTGLALLNTHRDISIDVEKIIDRFATDKTKNYKIVALINYNTKYTIIILLIHLFI